jgi:hypothetical protein
MRHEHRGSRSGSTCSDLRANVLWGGGKKVRLTFATLLIALLAIAAGNVRGAHAENTPSYTSQGLVGDATTNPSALFDVIVQGEKGRKTDDVAKEVKDVLKSQRGRGSALKRKFVSIAGVSATLTGAQILKLAHYSWVASITLDSKVEETAYSSGQMWPSSADVTSTWNALPAGTS